MKISLSNGLKEAFKKEFLTPVENIFKSKVILQPIDNNAKNKQRSEILKQGRANFDTSSNGLTPAQKVDLYCYHYFQMHFSSSYAFYAEEKELIIDLIKDCEVHFIDVGCGPMSSGLAFNCWLNKFAKEHKEINYYGIDLSSTMTTKANEIEKGKNVSFRFKNFITLNKKGELLKKIKESKGNKLTQAVIINYSFLFASDSLVVTDFVKFTNEVYDFFKDEEGDFDKLVVFYQNPTMSSLNTKWNDYKKSLKILKGKKHYPKNSNYSFNDIFGSSNRSSPSLKAKFDLLKSF